MTVLHGFRCMHCDWNPYSGGGKGNSATVAPCDCPSSDMALDSCPVGLAMKKHMDKVHNMRWG